MLRMIRDVRTTVGESNYTYTYDHTAYSSPSFLYYDIHPTVDSHTRHTCHFLERVGNFFLSSILVKADCA
jgi:hypothetical protein